MTDCPNVELRETLPEYLNGTLGPARRAEVEIHLATCAECTAELETIRLVREAYASAGPVSVDVGAIVSALPRPNRVRQPAARSWARSHAYQIAAAVSFVALGGMSLAVARSFFTGEGGIGPDSVAVVSMTESTIPEIGFGGGLTDLEEEDIETLLTALESIEALPVAEPATVVIGAGERQGT